MSNVNLNGIEIDTTETPYPCFVHIKQDDNMISLHHKELSLFIDALRDSRRRIAQALPGKQRREVG